jgi:hypothetical protein
MMRNLVEVVAGTPLELVGFRLVWTSSGRFLSVAASLVEFGHFPGSETYRWRVWSCR